MHTKKKERDRKKEKLKEEAIENSRKKWRMLLTQKSSDRRKIKNRRRKSEKAKKVGKSEKTREGSIGGKPHGFFLQGFNISRTVTTVGLLMRAKGVEIK